MPTKKGRPTLSEYLRTQLDNEREARQVAERQVLVLTDQLRAANEQIADLKEKLVQRGKDFDLVVSQRDHLDEQLKEERSEVD